MTKNNAVVSTDELSDTEMLMAPAFRNTRSAHAFTQKAVVGSGVQADFNDALAATERTARAIVGGSTERVLRTLAAQMETLDAMFAECARRAGINLVDYPDASERYMRLALKAQANSRATAEAIAKIQRGGEQVVRHIHVDNRGGQAVLAENLITGGQNGFFDEQAHRPAYGTAERSAALLGEEPGGESMPITCGEGQEAVPDARWRER